MVSSRSTKQTSTRLPIATFSSASGTVGSAVTQIGDDPQRDGLVLLAAAPGHVPLFVELDQHHRVGDPVGECRLHGLGHDLVAVDLAFAADRMPRPVERGAERAGRADGAAQHPADLAALDDQVVLPRFLEVAPVLRVGGLDDQLQASVGTHLYLRRIRELVSDGVPHPMFMASSTSRT